MIIRTLTPQPIKSHYGELAKIRLPVREYIAEIPIDEFPQNMSQHTYMDVLSRQAKLRLHALVCQETTQLELVLECDPWAIIKRKLHLTRWFPIKTITRVIDGKVLYPYLSIAIPKNAHYVQFNVNPIVNP